MNRAEKHELETNVLASRVESGLDSVQSVLPMILGGLAVLIVGSIIWGVYSSSVAKQEATAWTDYYFNMMDGDADTLLETAEAHPSSSMSSWAQISAADQYLYQGIDALYRNREEGEQKIKLAIETLEPIASSTASTELRSKAVLGLAKAHESLGDLEQANQYYDQLKTLGVTPDMLAVVIQQQEFLKSQSGKEFYAWFSELDPQPDSAIKLPPNLSLPPTTPDLQFSPTGAADTPPIDPTGLELPNLEMSPSSDSDGDSEPATNPADINSLELPDPNEPK